MMTAGPPSLLEGPSGSKDDVLGPLSLVEARGAGVARCLREVVVDVRRLSRVRHQRVREGLPLEDAAGLPDAPVVLTGTQGRGESADCVARDADGSLATGHGASSRLKGWRCRGCSQRCRQLSKPGKNASIEGLLVRGAVRALRGIQQSPSLVTVTSRESASSASPIWS
eukprot:scaffold25347_cov63-Phaeocystis_antarctica.AAC.2